MNLNTPFVFYPDERLICAGQPDAEGFRSAAAAGVVAVANLRPAQEMDWDEVALVEELGLEYLNIPVASPADLSQDNARRLGDFLARHEGKKVLVHCASSNRVGALLALHAALGGVEHSEALAIGRAAGLTRMEPMVAALLSQWGEV